MPVIYHDVKEVFNKESSLPVELEGVNDYLAVKQQQQLCKWSNDDTSAMAYTNTTFLREETTSNGRRSTTLDKDIPVGID